MSKSKEYYIRVWNPPRNLKGPAPEKHYIVYMENFLGNKYILESEKLWQHH